MATNPNDIIEIAARAEFEGVEDVVNVYQFQYQGAAACTDYETILDLSNRLDSLYGGIISHQSNTLVYRDLSFRNLTQGTILGLTPWPTRTVGGAASSNLAPGVAAVINAVTQVSRVILRKYLGGFTVLGLDSNGSFTSGLTAAILTFGSNLIAPYVGGGTRNWQYGYFSPKTSGFEIPTSATVTDIPGYQRRRKQGRGV